MADSIPSRPQQHEPQPGDYIGHYRITQLLARGGMGVVYKAFEATLNRHVAIKLLSPTLAADQEFVQRFLHEAQVVANLHHPNIIHIYYIGQHGDLLYFAMELVEGADLETLLALSSDDIDIGDSHGAAQGHEALRRWAASRNATAEIGRIYVRDGVVVVEQKLSRPNLDKQRRDLVQLSV